MTTFRARSDSNQRRERTRASAHAARVPKGHPMREARRERAAERLAAHVCAPTCRRFRTGREEWAA